MPEEIFLLSMFSILAGTGLLIYVITLIASHAKRRQEGTGSEGALRTSELEAMLRRIVREELQRTGRSGTERAEGDLDTADREGAQRSQVGPAERRFLDEHLGSELDDLDELEGLDDLDVEMDDEMDGTRRVRVRPGGSSSRSPRVR